MTLPLEYDYEPMEALSVDELPQGEEWQYEPKWDGFRCLAFRDGDDVELRSKAGKSLSRYFPETVAALRALDATKFVLDGEIVVPASEALSFDALLQRIHPAASRIKKLSTETPGVYIVFDLLVNARGKLLADLPLHKRRPQLDEFAAKVFDAASKQSIRLSPYSGDIRAARGWLEGRVGLDGVVAKRLDLSYASGERTGMQKVKRVRSADCVVGGFRYASKGHVIGSLLLGLYGADGLLNHVGYTSSLSAAERAALVPKLEKLVKPPGFTGKAPGGPSRWSTKRSSEWEPLAPELVVEVSYDHFSQDRFRHGTMFMRWRPDKAPRQCMIDQVETAGASALRMLGKSAPE
ncbi:MAG: ATP-dependent DNA ligase [Gemmatimonadaceae bacterium]